MGLSAFSRARVSMLPEMELEVKRFEEWNAAHQKSVRDLDKMHDDETADDRLQEIRDAASEAVKVIGEKVVAGLQENTPEGEPYDKQLREDHVRDMVGRRHVVDPQGEPESMMDKLHARIPTSTKSERLVGKTAVDGEGPTKKDVEAAEAEQQPWVSPDEEVPPPASEPGEAVPAAGKGAGVKGAEPSDTGDKKVPPTTQVEGKHANEAAKKTAKKE